jgi:hypothetical protein
LGSHPFNLAIRFLLEIAALVSLGIWGWNQSDGWIRYVLAPGLPVLIGATWGIFAVPGDPSRSGKAPIPVPGFIRLILELTIFTISVWALYDMNYGRLAWILGIPVLIHYLVSFHRIMWLLKH